VNRDDIIRIARKAGIAKHGLGWTCWEGQLERFADLVAAAERERLKWDGLHSCHPECDRPACVHTRKAVEAEREACAQIAFNSATYIEAAKAIRARGK
jgi:hypothetical protein